MIPKSKLEADSLLNRLDQVDVDSFKDGNIIDIPSDAIEYIPNNSKEKGEYNRKKFEDLILKNFERKNKNLATTFDNYEFLADQYIIEDKILAQLYQACTVCSLPRRILEMLEEDLFLKQKSFRGVARSYDIDLLDIERHISDCILQRKSSIPVGALVNSLVFEVNEFIERMGVFRNKLDNSLSNETIQTYLSVIGELRTAIKEVINLDSPEDNAIMMVKNVFNPLILSNIRILAKELDYSLEECGGYWLPGKDQKVKLEFKEFIRRTCKAYNDRLVVSMVKYAELCGIDPEVILGKPGDEDDRYTKK